MGVAFIIRVGKRFTAKTPRSSASPKSSKAQALDIVTLFVGGLFGICVVCFIPLALLFGSDSEAFTPQEAGIAFFLLLTAYIIGMNWLRRKFLKR